jgi:hypothetical protein
MQAWIWGMGQKGFQVRFRGQILLSDAVLDLGS